MTPEPQGRVAVITGAGSGIGREVALLFAERGASAVALLDIEPDGLAETSRMLASHDLTVTTHVVDVSDAEAMEQTFAGIVAQLGRVSYMINNAAMQTGQPTFPAVSFDQIDRVLGVNVSGVMIGTKLAHDHMAANGGGAIVATASGAGKVPLPSDPLYSASKAAVVMLTRASAAAFAKVGVRLNAVCPALVDTPMLTFSVQGRDDLIEALEHAEVMTPRYVAEAIVDLATDPSMVGQTPSVMP